MSKPIFSFIVIVLSLAFAFFYVRPLYGRVQTSRMSIVDLNNTLKRADTIKGLISETERDLAGIDALDRDRFAVFLPETIDTIRLANDVQHMGVARGVVVENIKVEEQKGAVSSTPAGPRGATGASGTLNNVFSLERNPTQGAQTGGAVAGQASVQDKKYRATKVSFMTTTSYRTFLNLLDDLEKSLGLINLTSLSFAPVTEAAGTKKSGVPLYQYTVEAEVYSLR